MTLRGKLARLIAATSLVSLVVFGAVVYLGIYLEEEVELEIVPEADDDATQFLLLGFGLAAPISLGLTMAFALWLARRTLRPIEQVIEAAGAMTTEQLGRRIPVPAGGDELRDMVETLNDLFRRLEVGTEGLRSFAADVSHELRTPLAVAISELEVASRKPRSHEEWVAMMERPLASLRRMVQLVEALLELARGGIAGPRDDADLVELAEEVTATFAARAQAAGVALEHTSAGAASARVQRPAVAAALAALLANALRYTPRGGRVAVEVADAGAEVQVRVDDDGPGVAAAERDEIFQPLRRGAAGRAAEGDDGLGLGLAIVRRVMEQHGGEVRVDGSPLGGARFTLVFMKS